MSDAPARTDLTVRRAPDGLLLVAVAGDWGAQSEKPGLGAVEKELAGGGVTALAFDTAGLGRWDSGLVALLFKCLGLCDQKGVKVRTETLPEGLAKLIGLAVAVPEKKGAARSKSSRRSCSAWERPGWRCGKVGRACCSSWGRTYWRF